MLLPPGPRRGRGGCSLYASVRRWFGDLGRAPCGARPRRDAGRGADVPLQQSGRAARAPARRGGVRAHAGARAGARALALARRCSGGLRVPDEDAAGIPRRAGLRPRLRWSPRRHPCGVALAAPPPRVSPLVVAGGWWVAIVELLVFLVAARTSAARPGTVLDLIWGYNGLGRIERRSRPGRRRGRLRGSTGLLRLFNADMGGQISWLLPAALARPRRRRRLGTLRRRGAPAAPRAALILWGGWLHHQAFVYSLMSGDHPSLLHEHPRPPRRGARRRRCAPSSGGCGRPNRRACRCSPHSVAGNRVLVVQAARADAPAGIPDLRVCHSRPAGARSRQPSPLPAVSTAPRFLAAAVAAVALLASLGGPLAYTLETVAAAQADARPAPGRRFREAASEVAASLFARAALRRTAVRAAERGSPGPGFTATGRAARPRAGLPAGPGGGNATDDPLRSRSCSSAGHRRATPGSLPPPRR